MLPGLIAWIVFISIFLPIPVMAQQLSNEEISARIQAAVAQRDENANRIVILAGQMAVIQAELDKSKKESAACAPKKDEKKP